VWRNGAWIDRRIKARVFFGRGGNGVVAQMAGRTPVLKTAESQGRGGMTTRNNRNPNSPGKERNASLCLLQGKPKSLTIQGKKKGGTVRLEKKREGPGGMNKIRKGGVLKKGGKMFHLDYRFAIRKLRKKKGERGPGTKDHFCAPKSQVSP